MGLIGDIILPTRQGGVWPFKIGNSSMFHGENDHLTRTPVSAGNRKTFTISAWCKPGTDDMLLYDCGRNTSNTDYFQFYVLNGTFGVINRAGDVNTLVYTSTAQFVDPSAWYHIVLTIGTNSGTAADRVRIWVNGVPVPLSASVAVAQGTDTLANRASATEIGKASGVYVQDGYLAEYVFVDGQVMYPNAFGQFSDQVTGLWVPKEYTGSYGTNGFRLDFGNAVTLGADVSGNGNHWTAVGAPTQTLDTPTNNYCTLNPIRTPLQGNVPVYWDGNLRVNTHAVNTWTCGTQEVTVPGTWYWGFKVTSGAMNGGIGVGPTSVTGANTASYWTDGTFYYNLGGFIAYGAPYTAGDTIGVAYDHDAATIEFFKNGVSQGLKTGIVLTDGLPQFYTSTVATVYTVDFGSTGFAYTPPAGFLPLCSANFPNPTTLRSSTVADIVLREGTGIEAGVTNLEFAPNFVVIKARSEVESWCCYDTLRGANKRIVFDDTNAEQPLTQTLNSFDTSGYTIGGTSGNYALVNKAGVGYLDLAMKADPQSGFEVVTFNLDGGGSLNHTLGRVPSVVLLKNRTAASNWLVWHTALGNSSYLLLNDSNAVGSATNWCVPAQTSVTFANTGLIGDCVAYLFADSDIFKAFSYTGNGNANGPFIHFGGRPRSIPFLKSVSARNWFCFDSVRNQNNPINLALLPNATNAEAMLSYSRFTSAGVKITTTELGVNGNAEQYVGLAILQSKKYANAF